MNKKERTIKKEKTLSYSEEEEIIDIIRKEAKIYTYSFTEIVKKYPNLSCSEKIRRQGLWKELQEKAGINQIEEIRKMIRLGVAEGLTSHRELSQKYPIPSRETLRKFGGWNKLKEEVGILSCEYSKEELFGIMRKVAKSVGRCEYNEIKKAYNLPSLATLNKHFGGWNKLKEEALINKELEEFSIEYIKKYRLKSFAEYKRHTKGKRLVGQKYIKNYFDKNTFDELFKKQREQRG